MILLYLLQRSTNRPEDNKAGSNTTKATPCKPKRKRVKKESTEKEASLGLEQVNGGVDKKSWSLITQQQTLGTQFFPYFIVSSFVLNQSSVWRKA